MNTVEIDTRKVTYASQWNELTGEQLIAISNLLLQRLHAVDFKVRAVLKLLRVQKSLVCYRDDIYFVSGIYRMLPFAWLIRLGIRKGKVKLFNREDAFLLSETMDWIFAKDEDGNPVNRLDNRLTKNVVPSIKIKKHGIPVKLYGPKDYLKDVRGVEFAKADTRYASYMNTGDEKYLNEMIAVLYRPRRWWKKTRYQDRVISRNSKAIGRLHLSVRYAILLFFQGCKIEIARQYPLVFDGQDSDGEDPGTGWAGIFRSLANDRIVDIDRVMELYIHTIMLDLNEKIRQKREMDKKLEKMRNHG